MKYRSDARRFGVMDAAIAFAGLGFLFCLMLPAIQRARELSRAAECSNNMKQILLGLHNYHDTYKTFPCGAMTTGKSSERMGPAWWFGLLPFMEERKTYELVYKTQRADSTPQAIPFNAAGMNPVLDNHFATFAPSWLHCPSSPLPAFERADGPIALPTYVAISGGCDIDPDSGDYSGDSFPELQAPVTNQVYRNRAKGIALHGGIMTGSGMLVPNAFRNMAWCTDGTSNTIIVGEQSDWLRDTDPNSDAQFHGDPGWDTEGTAGTGPLDGGGFLSGTAVSTSIEEVSRQAAPDGAAAPWSVDCYNVTTVRYGLNVKRVLGARPHPGCSEDHGPNNPLQSAHPLGAHVAFTDGSVLALSEDVDLAVLLRLAIRDDGQVVRDVPRVPPSMFETDGPVPGVSVPGTTPGRPARSVPGTTPSASVQDPTAAESAVLSFVRAAFLERDVKKAATFVTPDATRFGQGRGSVAESLRQIPQWPSPEILKLRQMHLFRRKNLEAMEERFPRLNLERVASVIKGGLGCHLVFSIADPQGFERKAHLIFVFQDVAGEMKVVYQDDGA